MPLALMVAPCCNTVALVTIVFRLSFFFRLIVARTNKGRTRKALTMDNGERNGLLDEQDSASSPPQIDTSDYNADTLTEENVRSPILPSATRRIIHDEHVDSVKRRRELEATTWQRFKPCLLVGGWTFIGSISNLTSPYLTKIKSDQLGGDQRAGEINSLVACVGAVIGLFTASLFGKLVDTYGRRPFFIISATCNLIATALTVFLQERIIVSMIVGAVFGLVQSSFVYAWVADVYSTKMRTQVISILVALGSVAALLMIVTAFLPQETCMLIAFGSTVVGFLYSFLIPESLDEANRLRSEAIVETSNVTGMAAEAKHKTGVHSWEDVFENPFLSMKHLMKSKVMIACVAIMCFYLMAQVGTGDVYMFYLAERINFTPQDNAILIMESGVVQPIVMVLLLPFLMRFLSPVMIIILSLGMLIIELVIVATVWAIWPVYVIGVPVVAMTNMLPPVVTVLIQNAGDERDQGRRMAGLQAFADLSDALGPLLFGLIFGNVSAALVFLPFIICAALAIVPLGLTLRLTKWLNAESREKLAASARNIIPA